MFLAAPRELVLFMSTPHWRLPQGVTRGLWDYAHSDSIAEDYDDYFACNRLFDFDQQVVMRALVRGGRRGMVADLGCGTGRALVPLCRQGFQGLAIDLSQRMLEIVQEKAFNEGLDIHGLRANLVELDGVADNSIDHAICLFSTLGMIRLRSNRERVMRHAARILKQDGRIVVHVHNFWFNLYDPGGPWWVLKNLARSTIRRDIEAGDKFFPYRGVPNMFLHVFTRREIAGTLRCAGFEIEEIIPLDTRRHRALRCRWLFSQLRANGWIVVGRKR